MYTRREELIWLAAWLEGEGCFHLRTQTGRSQQPRFIVEACSTDLDTLEQAKRFAGIGSIRTRTRQETTLVKQKKTIYSWRAERREEVLALLREIRPFLLGRRGEYVDSMFRSAELNPPVVTTHEDRSERAKKMWEKRRAKYGPSGKKPSTL